MFKYVGDISKLSHDIILNYCSNFNIAIDATLGKGNDAKFLCNHFKKVYAYDIQKEAVDNFDKNIKNIEIFLTSHEYLDVYIKEKVDCIMYNFGYLPGGDKSITTNLNSSLKSIEISLELLNKGGIITLCLYSGHNEGKIESDAIVSYTSSLQKNKYGVLTHKYLNRIDAPELIIIEKK